jgi:hypothetical protein
MAKLAFLQHYSQHRDSVNALSILATNLRACNAARDKTLQHSKNMHKYVPWLTDERYLTVTMSKYHSEIGFELSAKNGSRSNFTNHMISSFRKIVFFHLIDWVQIRLPWFVTLLQTKKLNVSCMAPYAACILHIILFCGEGGEVK